MVTPSIGTRRAVGARKRDIVRHVMTENWLITTLGVIVGCCLALAAGFWLSKEFQLPRLDLYYLVAGVLGLWLVGQMAAWQPSRRAAKVSGHAIQVDETPAALLHALVLRTGREAHGVEVRIGRRAR